MAFVGTIGHVAHGKSTVVKAISGVHTVRFKNELERNITIKLGYANAKVHSMLWKEKQFYLGFKYANENLNVFSLKFLDLQT